MSCSVIRRASPSGPKAASSSRPSEDFPEPYGPVSDQAPPAPPAAAVAAMRSATSSARAVTT